MLPTPFDDIETPAVLADAAPAVLADDVVAVTAAVTAADLEVPADAVPAVLVDTAAVTAAAAGVTTYSSGSWSKWKTHSSILFIPNVRMAYSLSVLFAMIIIQIM